MSSMNTYFRPVADSVGILSSGLCAMHCMLLPVWVVAGAVGPLSGLAGLADESVHLVLVQIAAPAAVVAMGIGFYQHRDWAVVGLGAVGVTLLVASVTVMHTWTGEFGERLASVVAAGFLITAHMRNRRCCRAGTCSDE